MPGTYSVRVTVPGLKAPLTRTVAVDADPLPKFTVADRAARQALLMSIYDWTKTLGEARLAARALTSQRDSIRGDLIASGKPNAATLADSIAGHIGRVSASIDRAFTSINGQRGPIEGWSGLPTADQRKAVGYGIEDGRKAIADLNKLVTTEIPTAYGGASAWKRKISPVNAPSPTRPNP